MERLHCASSLYIQTENFQFIVDPAEEPPRDYIVTATEDLHQNGIVAEVVLADIFSVGPPFTVTILRGRFIIPRGKLTIFRGIGSQCSLVSSPYFRVSSQYLGVS